MSKTQLDEYRKAARKLGEEPWRLIDAQRYLEDWCKQNEQQVWPQPPPLFWVVSPCDVPLVWPKGHMDGNDMWTQYAPGRPTPMQIVHAAQAKPCGRGRGRGGRGRGRGGCGANPGTEVPPAAPLPSPVVGPGEAAPPAALSLEPAAAPVVGALRLRPAAANVPPAPRPLGCTKCRQSPMGCTQCRNPNYRPWKRTVRDWDP